MESEEHNEPQKMVRITQVKNGEKQTVTLSEETAAELGFHSPFDSTPFPLSQILETLFGEAESLDYYLPESTLKCPGCGLDFGKFKQTGRLGCGDCYETFRPQLDWILDELHGASRHVGCTPDSSLEIANSTSEDERLSNELREAIAIENYERAAELRDRLKQLSPETAPATNS